jgi:hypothetical protein
MKYPTKKTIRIGTDYLPTLLKIELTQKQRSDLFGAMVEYLFLGKEPEKLDQVNRGVWSFVRWDLDYEKRRKGGQ